MTFSLESAKAELASRSTLAELFDLVQNTSARVAGSAPGATSLLYSGTVNGESAVELGKTLAPPGSTDLVRVDDSDVGRLFKEPAFISKVTAAIKADLAARIPGFSGLPLSEQTALILAESNRIWSNKTADGSTRLPYDPNKLSLWDIASKNFIDQATGDFRVLASGVDASSVLMQTELPALLARGGDFKVDGIEISHLRSAPGGVARQIAAVLTMAEAQTFFSDVGSGSTAAYRTFTPEDVGLALKDPTKLSQFTGYLGFLPDELKERFAVGQKALAEAGATLHTSGLAKALNKIGFVGFLLGATVASANAATAAIAGNTTQAKTDMLEWAADAAASGAGELIGATLGGIAAAAAAAAGIAISAPLAGALVLGGSLIGGFFGSEATKPYLEYLKDRDRSGRIDVFEMLQGLLFGDTWTVTDTPPPSLIAKALELKADFLVKSLELSYSREDIVALAKTSIAWRYALRELGGFAVEGLNYDEYNLDGSLDLFEPTTGEGAMTEEYLKDRAAMMMWKVRFDRGMADDDDPPNLSDKSKSYYEDWDIAAVEGNWDFVDRTLLVAGNPLTLQIDGAGISLHDHQVVFGSSKDEEFHGEGDSDRMYGGGGVDKIAGRKGSDYIEGNDGNDSLYGDEGHDTLRGGMGTDLLDGGADSDQLQGDAGNDTLNGGAGNDALLGGAGADEVHGDSGNDFLNGGSGADKLKGGADNDLLFDEGGSDTNYLWGDAGNDMLEIKAGTGPSFLDGGTGNDVLRGSPQGNNSLGGGKGNDSIQGGDGYDIIMGDGGVDAGPDGADLIEAGGGSDDITGGGGSDLLRGGTGNDNYFFDASGFGTDLIEDTQGNNRLVFAGQELKTASYDPDKLAWVAGDGIEIRKIEADGNTTLAISYSSDAQSTVYVRNWTAAAWDLQLTGEPTQRPKPALTPATPQTRPENNGVDFMRSNAADGGAGNDILIGNDAASLLLGGIGNDLLDGRDGNDWLEGGDGTDLILTGPGKDVVHGGAGNDLIRAAYKFDMYTQRVFADFSLYWSSEYRIFYLKDAPVDEWLWTSEDTVGEYWQFGGGDGGVGPHGGLAAFDIGFTPLISDAGGSPTQLWWRYVEGAVEPNLEPNLDVKLTLGRHAYSMAHFVPANPEGTVKYYKFSDQPEAFPVGTPQTFSLELDNWTYILPAGTQSAGAHIWGGDGNDALYGGNDNDKLYGEADNDLLTGHGGNDELSGGAGADSLSGGDGRDVLDGGTEADLLSGGLGADVLLGGSGADMLYGDAPHEMGNNVYPFYPAKLNVAAMGGDYLDGGSGNDTLWGNHGDDVLIGGSEDDLLFGGEGNDRLLGDDGKDTLEGGKGDDHLDGGANDDNLYGDEGDDLLQGGAGKDLLHGDIGDDVLDGGADIDVLQGGAGSDHLRGGAGDDMLTGDGASASIAMQNTGASGSTPPGPGDDILEGGAGNDRLLGGPGSDLYVFSVGDGQDVIEDNGGDGSRNLVLFKFGAKDVRKLKRDGLALVVEYGASDVLRVEGFYGTNEFGLGYEGAGAQAIDAGEAQARIAGIHFEDGEVWGLEEILAQAPAPRPSELPPDPYAHLADNYFVNALLMREEIKAAGKQSLTFSFAGGPTPELKDFHLFTEEQKQAVRDALARFSAVLNLSFVEQADSAGSDLRFFIDDLSSAEMESFAGYASPQTGEVHLNSTLYSEKRENEFGQQVVRDSLLPGFSGFEVLLHEIGHALGLKHPFEPPVLPDGENSTAHTVMSYTREGAPRTDLGAFDVAALQFLYGLPTGTHAGDTVHQFGPRWVQDAGGKDRFDGSAESQSLHINLSPGSWIYRGAKASSILATDQAFIGYGTVIEDALGGSGNDTLIGNDGANWLQGNAGDDRLQGGLGADTLVGGTGADRYDWMPGDGHDLVRDEGSSTDADVLHLAGVASFTELIFSSQGDHVVLTHKPTLAQMTLERQKVGQGVEFIELADGTRMTREELTALVDAVLPTEGADLLKGTPSNDLIDALGGNDRVDGSGGDDTLMGGLGVDTLLGGAGNDWLDGEDADGGAGNDTLLGAYGYTLRGGMGSDTYDLRQNQSAIRIHDAQDVVGEEDTVLLPASTNLANFRVDLVPSTTTPGTDDLHVNSSFIVVGAIRADGTTAGIERFVLGDGAVVTAAQVRELAQGRLTMGADTWLGTSGPDSVDLLAGNDSVDTRGGNDIVVGGSGNDTLRGGTGDERYEVRAGSGYDIVMDEDGTDTVKFLDATPDQVGVYRHGDNLWIYRTDDLRAQIEVEKQFEPYQMVGSLILATGKVKIERIEFSDGSSWTEAEIQARLAPTAPANLNLRFLDSPNSGDLVTGNAGHNRLTSTFGADTLQGGAGDDSYYLDTTTIFSSSGDVTNDVVVEFAGEGHDTLYARAWKVSLPEHVEDLFHVYANRTWSTYDGKPVPVQLTGNGLNNLLSRYAWSEAWPFVLDGGAGADTLEGGKGTDIFIVDNIGDVTLDSTLGDGDTVQASVSYSLATAVENLELTGSTAKRGTGNELANRLSGTGSTGADTLVGGAGDDVYEVDASDFVVESLGGGNDTLIASYGTYQASHYPNVESFVLRGAGTLTGTSGADALRHEPVGNSKATLYGLEGQDTLEGGGASVLVGGAGDDVLHSGGTVQWSRGDGHDQLTLTGPATVTLGAATELGELSIGREGRHLVLKHAGANAITVRDYFVDGTSSTPTGATLSLRAQEFERVAAKLSSLSVNAVSWSELAMLIAGDPAATLRVGSSGADTISGSAGNDTMAGGRGDDRLDGGAGTDWLLGEAGNDTLIGGDGDTLVGGVGNDVYRPGSGSLRVWDEGGTADELALPEGASPESTMVRQQGESLLISWESGANQVVVADFFAAGADSIELLSFANGVAWNRAEVAQRASQIQGDASDNYLSGSPSADAMFGLGGNDTLSGSGGNDTLSGGTGSDWLEGGVGDDVYLFALGDGVDTIAAISAAEGVNVLRFGAGIDPAAVSFSRVGSNLELRVGAGTDKVVVEGFYRFENPLESPFNPLQRVEFSGNATVWTAAHFQGLARTVNGSAGNDSLAGTSNGERMLGHAGNDTLLGNGGEDWLDGGLGDDSLDGGSSDDVMAGGAGDDRYVISQSGDRIIEKAGEGYDRISSSLSFQSPDISFDLPEQVEEFNLLSTSGRWVTGNDQSNRLVGNAGSDTLSGGGGADTLLGGLGNDDLSGDAGNDWLEGGDGADYLRDSDGVDVLRGGMGDDFFDATSTSLNSRAFLSGGSGDDNMTVQSASGTVSVLVGGAGRDMVNAQTERSGLLLALINRGDGSDGVTLGNWNHPAVISLGGGIQLADIKISAAIPNANGQISHLMLSLGQPDSLDLPVYGAMNGSDGRVLLQIVGASDVAVYDLGHTIRALLSANPTDATAWPFSQKLSEQLVFQGANQAWGGGLAIQYGRGVSLDAMDPSSIRALLNTDGLHTGPVQSLTPPVVGTDFADSLIGSAGNDVIQGLAGNDTLDGGSGADTLEGGLGDDSYVIDQIGDVILENANEGIDSVTAPFNFTLSAELENLSLSGSAQQGIGNSLANRLSGNAQANLLRGLDGADSLDGGAGSDTMEGGGGDDIYTVDNAGDWVSELPDQGVDSVHSHISYTLGSDVENLVLLGSSALSGTGNGMANVLTGNSGNNRLDGSAGNDTMVGGAGDDTYVVDSPSDQLTEASAGGVDTVEAAVSYVLPAEVEKLTLTGTADLDATGNTLANTLTGNSGSNRLDGGAGNDTMVGGAGDDTYVVDVVGDVITEAAGGGTDTVETAFSYTLPAEVEALRLTGSGATNATGNALANSLTGNSGNNRLDGKAGADTMAGGTGNDTYVVDASGDVITEAVGGGTDTVEASVSYTLPEEVERLTLTGTGSINATGNAVANTLTGNTGANRLDGGAGADTMVGGGGNDTYVVDATGDVVTEAASGGTDTVEASISYTLPTEVEKLTLIGTGAIDATGNALANTLNGNSGNNRLDGKAGADTMVGGAGDDTYVVDNAADVITEGTSAGNDMIEASLNFTLPANVEDLRFTGSTGRTGTGNTLANRMTGTSGADRLSGLDGNDTLDGGAGKDTLVGGKGDDTYVVNQADDVITELAGEGTDTVQSQVTLTLGSNLENLTLLGTSAINATGNTGNNVLTGNSAANTLTGGDGNDTLDGAAGNDSLVGGKGADRYRFGRGYGTDTITENDATANTKDVVEFASGIAPSDVSFKRNGNALEVRVAGSPSELLTIKDWYLGNAYHVEEFRFVDSPSTVITDAQAAGLVQAMAAFGASALEAGEGDPARRRQQGLSGYGLAVGLDAMV